MERSKDPIYENYPQVDYSRVEDIAGVDYRIAMYLTGGYIFLHLFGRFLPQTIWVFLTTGLVVVIWYYFRRYFDAVGDTITSRWVNVAIGGYVLFGITNLWVLTSLSMDQIVRNVTFLLDPVGYISELSNTIFTGIIISMLLIVAACFRLFAVRKRHPLSLRGIAITTMLVTPFYMFFCIYQNAGFLREGASLLNLLSNIFGSSSSNSGVIGDGAFQIGTLGNLFFMIPYLFLLRHFYRADSEDATP